VHEDDYVPGYSAKQCDMCAARSAVVLLLRKIIEWPLKFEFPSQGRSTQLFS